MGDTSETLTSLFGLQNLYTQPGQNGAGAYTCGQADVVTNLPPVASHSPYQIVVDTSGNFTFQSLISYFQLSHPNDYPLNFTGTFVGGKATYAPLNWTLTLNSNNIVITYPSDFPTLPFEVSLDFNAVHTGVSGGVPSYPLRGGSQLKIRTLQGDSYAADGDKCVYDTSGMPSSCSTLTTAAQCLPNFWPDLTVVPTAGLPSGGSTTDLSIAAARARLLFDGATVIMCSTYWGATDVSNPTNLSPLIVGTRFDTSNLQDSNFGCVLDTQRGERFKIVYDDTLASVPNNAFRIYRTGAAANIPFRLRSDWAGISGMTLVVDIAAGGLSNAFSFRFNAAGEIDGITPYSPIQCLRYGTAGGYIQAFTGPTEEASGQTFFYILTMGTLYTKLLAMDLGACCSTGFGTGTTEAQVCSVVGLKNGTDGASTCQTFMFQSPTGFCFANPSASSCVTQCRLASVDCDAIYKGYCGAMNQDDAMNNPLCGCFMPDTFYANYNKSLTDSGLGALLSGPGGTPACDYAKCSSSNAISTFKHKQAANECPAMTISMCVSNITINNNGVISGGINADTKQSCLASSGGGGTSGGGSSGGSSSSSFTDLVSSASTFVQSHPIEIGAGVVIFIVILILATFLKGGGSKKSKTSSSRRKR